MKKLLFICSQNKLRSPTAEAIFSEYEGLDVESAGLNHDAEVALSVEAVERADIIFVEHIKRRWADISAETAGEQYTPDDVIGLIAEIIASKIEESDKLLKIYDCTCGGGNLLFGVEDRINERSKRLTQTFGQDWNDALYALAKIESRFRVDSKIEHGNTLCTHTIKSFT